MHARVQIGGPQTCNPGGGGCEANKNLVVCKTMVSLCMQCRERYVEKAADGMVKVLYGEHE